MVAVRQVSRAIILLLVHWLTRMVLLGLMMEVLVLLLLVMDNIGWRIRRAQLVVIILVQLRLLVHTVVDVRRRTKTSRRLQTSVVASLKVAIWVGMIEAGIKLRVAVDAVSVDGILVMHRHVVVFSATNTTVWATVGRRVGCLSGLNNQIVVARDRVVQCTCLDIAHRVVTVLVFITVRIVIESARHWYTIGEPLDCRQPFRRLLIFILAPLNVLHIFLHNIGLLANPRFVYLLALIEGRPASHCISIGPGGACEAGCSCIIAHYIAIIGRHSARLPRHRYAFASVLSASGPVLIVGVCVWVGKRG